MTVSSENATPPQSTEFTSSNSLLQIQIKQKFRFEFVPQDTEKSEYLDLVDFGELTLSVETL